MKSIAITLSLLAAARVFGADPPPINTRHLAQAPVLPQTMLPCRCDCTAGDECVCPTGVCNCNAARTKDNNNPGWTWDPNRRVWYRYVVVQPTYYAPQPRFGFVRGGRGGC